MSGLYVLCRHGIRSGSRWRPPIEAIRIWQNFGTNVGNKWAGKSPALSGALLIFKPRNSFVILCFFLSFYTFVFPRFCSNTLITAWYLVQSGFRCVIHSHRNWKKLGLGKMPLLIKVLHNIVTAISRPSWRWACMILAYASKYPISLASNRKKMRAI